MVEPVSRLADPGSDEPAGTSDAPTRSAPSPKPSPAINSNQTETSSNSGSSTSNKSETAAKSRTLSNKKRKKQNRAKKNGNSATQPEVEVVKCVPAAVEEPAPVSNNSSSPQNRFSNKSGRSKPNR